jgi:hypothetical protein
MKSFQEGRAVVSNFSPSTKQHIKSLKDLYVEIYNAWQSIVSNELILPSLASSSTWSTNKSQIPETIDGKAKKEDFDFLSDERSLHLDVGFS